MLVVEVRTREPTLLRKTFASATVQRYLRPKDYGETDTISILVLGDQVGGGLADRIRTTV